MKVIVRTLRDITENQIEFLRMKNYKVRDLKIYILLNRINRSLSTAEEKIIESHRYKNITSKMKKVVKRRKTKWSIT